VQRRFSILLYNERPQLFEEIVCKFQIKGIRALAAAGEYARPQILQNGRDQLVGSFGISSEQMEQLEEVWKEFVRDIKAARTFLGKYTSKAADQVEAVMETGVYTPASSVQAAQVSDLKNIIVPQLKPLLFFTKSVFFLLKMTSNIQNFRRRLSFPLQNFLLATDAVNASDEFLLKEGQAFIKLYIGAIQVLTPMQFAIVSTSCRPLVTHLPDVCDMLLNSNNSSAALEGYTISAILDNDEK
jgi:hypothetical protein